MKAYVEKRIEVRTIFIGCTERSYAILNNELESAHEILEMPGNRTPAWNGHTYCQFQLQLYPTFYCSKIQKPCTTHLREKLRRTTVRYMHIRS